MTYDDIKSAVIDGAMIDAMQRGYTCIDDQASEATGTLAGIIGQLMADNRAENLDGMTEVFRLCSLALKHGDRYTEEIWFDPSDGKG